jgi:hypothetical protein
MSLNRWSYVLTSEQSLFILRIGPSDLLTKPALQTFQKKH